MTKPAHFIRLDSLAAVPQTLRGGVVAIGNFDGCHRGHQHVFRRALALAKSKGVPALVLTFEPHPRDVFAPEPFLYRLTDAEEKARLIEAMGFDGVVIMPFSRDLSGVEATDFVSRYLIDALAVSGVVVGGDFLFGKGRGGTPDFLCAEAERLRFAAEIVDMLEDGSEPVSSSRVRTALTQGDVTTANSLLGYHHFLCGKVITGDQRGRDLGFPTANIALPKTTGLAQGVYAVSARVGGKVHGGVAAYGKPMFDNSLPPFETHIFDFSADIYGQVLEVALLGFIRAPQTFDSLDALIAQMGRDAEIARITIAQARPLSELDAALGIVMA